MIESFFAGSYDKDTETKLRKIARTKEPEKTAKTEKKQKTLKRKRNNHTGEKEKTKMERFISQTGLNTNYRGESCTIPPMVITKRNGYDTAMDLGSRLLKDRIITLYGPVDDLTAEIITDSLLILESEDPEAPVTMFINSPGGSVTAGMSIYDTMQYISCPVRTIATGLAASMASFLLAAGEPGQRMAMPNAEVMIHQPLGGMQGQASDMDIAAKHILKTREKLNQILSERCGQPLKKIAKDTERDNWLSAEEALQYGLIDSIVAKNAK